MPDDDRRDGMQRVRVGLTGLAVVLVLIALATAFSGWINRQAPENMSAVENKTADEPLADLGMAPGAAPDENTTAGESKGEK